MPLIGYSKTIIEIPEFVNYFALTLENRPIGDNVFVEFKMFAVAIN